MTRNAEKVSAIALALAACVGLANGCGKDERLVERHDSGVDGASGGSAGASSDATADENVDGELEAGDGSVAGDPPVIPVGFDAYRMWDRLFYVRLGTRAYMRSTYDRSGGNEAADASHFLRQDADDKNVTLDVAGPGILYFVRTNHWHGSPWHYSVDGVEHEVVESSTADPNQPVAGSVFIPQSAFPSPLTFTWSTTKGADLSWIPIGFQNAFSLAYGRTHYGTGYYIHHAFPKSAPNLSAPIETWTEQPPPKDVLDFVGRAGEDIAPTGVGVTKTESAFDVHPAHLVTLANLQDGPRVVRAIKLRVARQRAIQLGRARLRVIWDGQAEPSIDAPVALFFGAGTLYNRNDVEWLVRGLLVNVHFEPNDVVLSIYYPMPYQSSARFQLVSDEDSLDNLRFEVRTMAYTDPPNHAAHFHATYKNHTAPIPGQDLVVLDTNEVEGGGPRCGSFVGMSFIFSDQAVLSTLEGDPRFFFDDSASPQGQGTGTEEWGGGGDYWGGENMTLPFAGHPVGAPSPAAVKEPEDSIESAYRFLLADSMPFGKRARIQLEHGADNASTEHYQTIAYWYGAPSACLVLSDAFHVGDVADEATHDYVSADASPVEAVSSRYEWGVDHLGQTEIFPESTDTGRHTTGTSEFTLAIARDNQGVLLRRKLDYAFPNQRAEVYVADVAAGAPFEHAGTWYLAGSNRVVYSNPPGELDGPEHIVKTSNRRWREDEFLVSSALTRGRSRIRVRIQPVPSELPLFPGDPPAPTAWSEFRYWVYSYVLPKS